MHGILAWIGTKNLKMGTVAKFSSANSSIPWLWIIEYLAGFKQADTSILHDLVEMAPELPNVLAKNTREMVALRCLEDLFGARNGNVNDGFPDTEEKVRFALSESCEDVLLHILQETSALDLKMAGPELLKWDVHPFIMHKRAAMPKSAIQQLKDTILEGNDPLAAFLTENSGLMCVNESGRTRTDDINDDARTLRVDGAGTHVQTMATNENLIHPTCENGQEASGDNLHNKNLLPSKRNRKESNDLAGENMVGHFNEIHGEFDPNSNAKRLKQDTVCTDQSVEQISVPQHHSELLENLPERVVGVAGGEGCDVANQSRDAGLEDSQFSGDGCDECLDSMRLQQNGDFNDDKIKHNQTMVGHNTDEMPQDTSEDEPVQNVPLDEVNVTEPTSTDAALLETQQKVPVDESKGQTEHFHEEEISSHDDEYHNERVDVAKKKSHFLSSQCLLGNYSMAASDFTEQNLCVKCNKDGQFLACNTSSCPLVVHENCLGYPAKFDEKGKFYCPFCAYSLAISEYLEAKEKAYMARKELSAFFRMGLDRKEQRHSGQKGGEEIFENGHLGEQQNGQYVHDVSDHLCQGCIGNRQQSEPLASCFNDNLPSREKVTDLVSETVCVPTGEKVGKENMVQECSSIRLLEGQQDQASANPRSEGDNLIFINTDVAPVDQREAEGRIQKEDLQLASSNLVEKPVCAPNISRETTSEGENDKFIISNYSIRVRRQEGQYTYPPIPLQLRRKKVPWTAKEEEMLKKGVQKFTTSIDDRNIPWKKILELGSSVFLRGRTTIDLKDKWRNMCKGSPRTK